MPTPGKKDERPLLMNDPDQGAGSARSAAAGTLPYWPEVDGLRTLAVLSVLVFHFDRTLLSGGFVGVDIFFVISGFLITSLLDRDGANKNFPLAHFYQRRIARIAPALFLVIGVTLVAAAFLYSAQDLASAGAASAFSAISLANVKFMLQGDYFRISSDAQPLLHYWSLSVEEQFYLFFPPVFVLLSKWPRLRASLIVLIATLSLAVCVLLTRMNQVWAFYLLPSRCWELLAGAGVATLTGVHSRLSDATINILALLGIMCIGVSLFTVREGANFPGLLALLPVIGASFLLLTAGRGGLFPRIFANPALVFVGKRSYSLYLWHWPIYSIVDYSLFSAAPAMRDVAKILLTVGLSFGTYSFYERPLRRALSATGRQWLSLSLFLIVAAATVVAGLQIRSTFYLDAKADSLSDGGVVVAGGSRGKIVVIGDSQAAMYGSIVSEIARSGGFHANLLGIPAGNELPLEPNTKWRAVIGFIRAQRPDVVVIAQSWVEKLPQTPTSLSDAIAEIRGSGCKVIVMLQPPIAPPTANREGLRDGRVGPFFELPQVTRARNSANNSVRDLGAADVEIIDPSPLFTNRDGSVRLIGVSGRLLFQDDRHLSWDGTSLVGPLLRQAIHRFLEGSK